MESNIANDTGIFPVHWSKQRGQGKGGSKTGTGQEGEGVPGGQDYVDTTLSNKEASA